MTNFDFLSGSLSDDRDEEMEDAEDDDEVDGGGDQQRKPRSKTVS